MTKDEVEAIDRVLRAALVWRSVVTETGHPKVYELAMAINAYRRTMEPRGWPVPTLEQLLAPAEPEAPRDVDWIDCPHCGGPIEGVVRAELNRTREHKQGETYER